MALEAPTPWSFIQVATDNEDVLEALLLALLLSRRRPLDIVFDRRARISRTP